MISILGKKIRRKTVMALLLVYFLISVQLRQPNFFRS